MLPTVVSSWLDVVWVVKLWETVELEKPGSVAVLYTNYYTPFKNVCFANSPSKWHTYTIHVSRLKNPPLHLH
jgi:hypothetical protein